MGLVGPSLSKNDRFVLLSRYMCDAKVPGNALRRHPLAMTIDSVNAILVEQAIYPNSIGGEA